MLRILDPGANEARISDNPPRIPALFSHYPVSIWRRRSESHCVSASFQSSQPPCKSINYARSPVKSASQRRLRKSRTILSVAVQNFPTILAVSSHWSFYWRSLPGFVEVSRVRNIIPSLPNDAVPDDRIVLVECRTRKNSISWTQSSRICVPGNDFPHYPGTILLLCIHSTLLAISLAIGMMDLAYRRCRRG